PVVVTFTPHLVPMNRGILATIYVRGRPADDLHAILLERYANEPFVHVLPFGEMTQTRHVRGSNMTFIGVTKDRIPGRAIIGSALDMLGRLTRRRFIGGAGASAAVVTLAPDALAEPTAVRTFVGKTAAELTTL